jgi:hypothetical protein
LGRDGQAHKLDGRNHWIPTLARLGLGPTNKGGIMNERIRELVKQAGGHFSTHTLTSNPVQYRESIGLWDNNIEKFAELIVRECAMLVEGFILEQEVALDDYQEYEASAVLKEHFGVES